MSANEEEVCPVHETSLTLEGDRNIVIARTFNGPARIVFEAYTRPELVARWWAPQSHGVSIVACDADVRVGRQLSLRPPRAFRAGHCVLGPVPRGDAAVHGSCSRRCSSRPRRARSPATRPSPSRSRSTNATAKRTSCRGPSARRRSSATRSSRPAWKAACARRWIASKHWWPALSVTRRRQPRARTSGLRPR